MDSPQRGSQAPQVVVRRYLDEVLNRHSVGAIDELISDKTLKQRVHLIGGGTHEGLFQGCPPTGRRWTATCTAIYRVDRGRIAESWLNWDLLALMNSSSAFSGPRP